MTEAPVLLLRAMLVALALIAAAACGDSGDIVELRYDDGALRARGRVAVDANGDLRLEGRWLFWYPSGALQCEGEFDDGPVWSKDAELAGATVVPRGGRVGEWVMHSEIGHPTARGTFRDGERHGPWLWFHVDGAGKAAAEYVRGLEHGIVTRWHANGALAEKGRFERGVPVGEHRTWHANGELATVERFEDGARSGFHRRFSPDGVLLEEVAYHRGERSGLSSAWDDEGDLLWTVEFADGEVAGPPRYARDGVDLAAIGDAQGWIRTAELVVQPVRRLDPFDGE